MRAKVVYSVSLYFAIRGSEHHRIRHTPSQLQLHEPVGHAPYLVYTEDVSNTNQGGLLHRKKTVVHHAHIENPQRCLIRFYTSSIIVTVQLTVLRRPFTSSLWTSRSMIFGTQKCL